jgi:transcriptional regulator with XRE-family HTH domain
VFAIFNVGKKLFDKLRRSKSYRDSYIAEHVRRGIAYQIRALRDQRDWNQGKFSKYLGKPQSVVSRLEDPSYGKVTVQTLLEVASVFDVALQVRFVPYSLFLRATRDLSPASMHVPGFEMEAARPSKDVLKEYGEDQDSAAPSAEVVFDPAQQANPFKPIRYGTWQIANLVHPLNAEWLSNFSMPLSLTPILDRELAAKEIARLKDENNRLRAVLLTNIPATQEQQQPGQAIFRNPIAQGIVPHKDFVA